MTAAVVAVVGLMLGLLLVMLLRQLESICRAQNVIAHESRVLVMTQQEALQRASERRVRDLARKAQPKPQAHTVTVCWHHDNGPRTYSSALVRLTPGASRHLCAVVHRHAVACSLQSSALLLDVRAGAESVATGPIVTGGEALLVDRPFAVGDTLDIGLCLPGDSDIIPSDWRR